MTPCSTTNFLHPSISKFQVLEVFLLAHSILQNDIIIIIIINMFIASACHVQSLQPWPERQATSLNTPCLQELDIRMEPQPSSWYSVVIFPNSHHSLFLEPTRRMRTVLKILLLLLMHLH